MVLSAVGDYAMKITFAIIQTTVCTGKKSQQGWQTKLSKFKTKYLVEKTFQTEVNFTKNLGLQEVKNCILNSTFLTC